MIGKIGTILKWIILLPIFLAVVLLAVANDQIATVHLNPFDTGDPFLKIDLALYQLAFLVFAAGALVGGLISWAGQRKHRLRARRSEEGDFARSRGGSSTDAQLHPRNVQAAAFLPRPERG